MIDKYVKLQTNIIKAFDKYRLTNKKSDFPYLLDEYDENIAIIINNYYVLIIPKSFWYLDNKKIFENRNTNIISKFIEAEKDKSCVEYFKTNECIICEKTTLVKFTTNSEKTIYLNEKYIKWFNFSRSTFMGSGKKNLVLVFDDMNNLDGIILPVVINKEKTQ